METGRIKELFQKDIFLKFSSVVIAIILWAYVSFVLDPETQKELVNIPVKFINEQTLLNNGLTIVNSNYTVSAEVKGRRSIIASIDRERLWAIVDLSEYSKTGRNRANIKITGLPSSVEFVKEPEDILIDIDKAYVAHKSISIAPKGEPQKGFAVYNPSVKPSEIQIQGPKSLIDSIYDVRVIVDVTNLSSNYETRERVVIIDHKGSEIKGLKTNVDMVEVSMPIVQTKEVTLRLDTKGVLERDSFLVKSVITPDKVNIFGTKDKLNSVNELKLEPIDITGASKSITKKVKIITPQGTSIVGNDGYAEVNLEIQRQTTKTISIPVSNLQVRDKRADFDYKFLQERTDVIIKGLESDINNLNTGALTGSISVKELGEGLHSLPVILNLPEGIKLQKGNNVAVQISGK